MSSHQTVCCCSLHPVLCDVCLKKTLSAFVVWMSVVSPQADAQSVIDVSLWCVQPVSCDFSSSSVEKANQSIMINMWFIMKNASFGSYSSTRLHLRVETACHTKVNQTVSLWLCISIWKCSCTAVILPAAFIIIIILLLFFNEVSWYLKVIFLFMFEIWHINSLFKGIQLSGLMFIMKP